MNNKEIKKLGEAWQNNKDFTINIGIDETDDIKIETLIEELTHIFIMFLTTIKNNKISRIKEHEIIKEIISVFKKHKMSTTTR